MSTRSKGNVGENFVCEYLEKQGYCVLCRNFVAKGGEIDIILEKNQYIVFAEVKLRKEFDDCCPAQAVDTQKQTRIKNTAQFFLDEYHNMGNVAHLKVRFDVAEVFVKNGQMRINYIENAFI